MNPETGEFHPVERKKSFGPLKARAKGGLHPKHAELVFKANQKRVPTNWPIFTKGEVYEIDGVACELVKVTQKDLYLSRRDWQPFAKPTKVIERDSIHRLQGREFRVRFTKFGVVVVRPVVGNVVTS